MALAECVVRVGMLSLNRTGYRGCFYRVSRMSAAQSRSRFVLKTSYLDRGQAEAKSETRCSPARSKRTGWRRPLGKTFSARVSCQSRTGYCGCFYRISRMLAALSRSRSVLKTTYFYDRGQAEAKSETKCSPVRSKLTSWRWPSGKTFSIRSL